MKLFTKSVVAAVLAGAVILLGGAQAKANSYQVTGTLASTPTNFSDAITVAGFNTSLGTLQSVTVSLASGVSSVLTVTAGDSTTTNIDANTKVTFTLQDAGGNISLSQVIYSQDYVVSSLAPNATVVSGTLTGAGNVSSSAMTNAATLNEFSASSVSLTVAGSARTTISYDSGNATATQVTHGTDVVTVTYNYTPTAVPEPTTWAMLFGGIGTLVLVQQLRRRNHA